MVRRICCLSLVTLILAAAEPAPVATRVEAVTVYLDRAYVSRSAAVELPAGASTVVLDGFPDELEEASLRVQLPDALRLESLAVQRVLAADTRPEMRKKLEQEQAGLQARKAGLDDRLRLLSERQQVLQKLFDNHLAAVQKKDTALPSLKDYAELEEFLGQRRAAKNTIGAATAIVASCATARASLPAPSLPAHSAIVIQSRCKVPACSRMAPPAADSMKAAHGAAPQIATESAASSAVDPAAHPIARQWPDAARNTGAIRPYCGLIVRIARSRPASTGRRSANNSPPISNKVMNGPACSTSKEMNAAGPMTLAAIKDGDCGAAIRAISRKLAAEAMSHSAFAAP